MDINEKQKLEELSYRRLRLYSGYRIVNSNHIFEQGELPYIGHRTYRQQLEAFLSNSDGGAILITGFRGVGKSTMVHNAVSTLNQNGFFRVIPISIVLPAEKTYGEVLVEIIRKLYETLSKKPLWNELRIETQERICLAYNRTLLNIKHSSNMSMEAELSMQNPLGLLPTTKTKGGMQHAVERSYLAFSEHDVEFELIQCIEALYESNARNKVVIVVDEIDKITATQEGMKCFDNLLERMKNLISSSNALFVFVAGIDIYMRWESDSQRINSLYDSLFDYHIYLPCIWDSVEELFEVIDDKKYVHKPVKQEFLDLVETGYTTILEESFRMIEAYILFKGKGLPRKILGIFNDFLVWDGNQPCFLLNENRIQCIEALYESNARNKVVIVVDEIDKITATQEGMKCFDNLLERMKNLISSSNALFVFVAGIDIYMRWESDSQRINSLYDSLFDYHIYLPCIWDSVEELFEVIDDKKYVHKPVKQEFLDLVETGYTTILEESFRMIEAYILFKGKGLPRKILGIFNDFLVWDGNQPCFLLNENRIQAILLVDKLLKKFRSYIFTAKITTIYERDINYTLFFSMLEFLLFQENASFTKEQIKTTLLKEQGTLGLYFDNALENLLGEFEKLAFIRKTESEYEVIDDTLLKQDRSLKILDQDLLLNAISDVRLPDRKDDSIDERFHDQIKLVRSVELTDFWNDYKAKQIIADSEQMMIFRVTLKRFDKQRYAIVYKGEKQVNIKDGSKITLDNVYSVGSYRFSGPYFIDTVDHIKNGIPVASLRTAVDGYALVHLIEAKLRNLVIYQIICQILSLIDYLHKKGFGNVRLKPDNIIVCKNASIKVLDLRHICRLGSKKNPCVTRIYSAPEVYLSVYSAEADIYSAGILLTEMIVGKSLSRYYTERHIEVKTVMEKEPCSQKLKSILVKATAFDPDNRFTQGSDFKASLDKCPEFRRIKRFPFPKAKDGTVIGYTIKDASSEIPTDDNMVETVEKNTAFKAKKDDKTQDQHILVQKLKDIDIEHTGFLGGAYFNDEDLRIHSDNVLGRGNEVYLVRQSNNERVIIKKSLFRIGKEISKVDYCLENTSVSRVHAELMCIDDTFYIKDINSTNGTYKNSERIEPNKLYKIVHGDFIRIANEEFVFNQR